MPADPLARDVGSIVVGRLDAAEERLLLVNPAADAVAGLVEGLSGREDPPDVGLLTEKAVMKAAMEDFLIASRAADLVEREVLRLRMVEVPPKQTVVVTDVDVTALVPVGEDVGGVGSDDDALVTAALDHYGAIVNDADSHTLLTPPLSRIRASLAEEIGEDVATDFDAVLAAIDDAHPDGTGLDGVTIAILVAARNGELLYDVSKWGEDVGLASKATFSRTKSELEDAGVIVTEKVPIQVGRPRLRLRLGDDELADADPGGMAERASTLLQS